MSDNKTMPIAFEGSTSDGTQVVGFGNIKVIVSHDADGWFAQGLDIDYAAEGDSLDEVKRAFEQGLYSTIEAHLRRSGTVRNLLKPCPPDVWQELMADELASRFRVSHVSIHNPALPYAGIEFFAQATAQ